MNKSPTKKTKQQTLKLNNDSEYVLHKIPHKVIKNLNSNLNTYYKKLIQKDGENLNVGNPLSKSFVSKIKEGTLSSLPQRLAELALQLYSSISYWENNEKRIT